MLDALLERWPISLPRTATLCIVLLTLIAIGVQGWRLSRDLTQPMPSLAGLEVSQSDSATSVLPVILSAGLFGSTSGTAAATGANTIVPATSGFGLRAAFAPTGNTGGGAIIETPDGQARWYPIGGAVPGGATLKEVHRDHVIFDRNGVLEKLEFPSLSELARNSVAAAAQSSSLAGDTDSSESTRNEPIPVDASAEEKARLIRQRLEELRNRSRT